MSFARSALTLGAIPFLAIGVAFLGWPAATGAHVDLAVTSATADNDVRSVYGGLQIACGAQLLACAARPA